VTGPSVKVRDAVYDRAGFRCEVCGAAGAYTYSLHHRRPRGMGGSRAEDTDQPPNLLLICGSGTTGCHGRIESYRENARDLGLLLRPWQDPAETPVLVRGRWVHLTPSGTYRLCPQSAPIRTACPSCPNGGDAA
jgi:hypothetical protein